MMLKPLPILLLISMMAIGLSVPAGAYSENADEIPGDLTGLCVVCHEDPNGGGTLNPYGIDYAAYQSVEDIATLDSDKDGFSNQEELDEGTFPGDPDDFPETDEPEGSPGFGLVSMVIGIMGAFLLIHGRKK